MEEVRILKTVKDQSLPPIVLVLDHKKSIIRVFARPLIFSREEQREIYPVKGGSGVKIHWAGVRRGTRTSRLNVTGFMLKVLREETG